MQTDASNNTQIGGIKKKNGHKLDCNCPICINIKHAKGGAGYDVVDYESNKKGGKKSNTNCNNPNCNYKNCKCINCNCNCRNCNCRLCKAKKNRRKTKRVNNMKKNRTSRRK